jgi:predicted phage tail component-like protein
LTTLKAYSAWPTAPVLPLGARGPETDRIQIRKIEGLGPVKAAVNTSPYGSMDGESYTGSKVPSRNIVITVGLNPDWMDWSMEALRRLLYAYFMPKQGVRLVFESNDDFPSVEITGVTETVEPSIFSKDVDVDISIICPDPYFTAVDETVIVGNTSAAEGRLAFDVDYMGSIETGVRTRVRSFAGPAPTVIGVQIGDPALTYFRVGASVDANKDFLMSSLPGQKYAQNINLTNGVITNLLYKVQEGSDWPILVPGRNHVEVITDAGIQDWELAYFARFGGL